MASSKWSTVPDKYRKQLEWWYKAYQWFNRKYPSRALKLSTYAVVGKRYGFTWGSSSGKLSTFWSPGIGLWGLGGLYTQHYIDYYLLKNAPLKNPPSTRPRKPAGYDTWLAKFKGGNRQ